MKTSCVVAAIAIAIFTTGCFQHIRPETKVPKADSRLPLMVSLVLTPEFREHEDEFARSYSTGWANRWISDTGKGLTRSLTDLAHEHFERVRVVSAESEAQPNSVLIIPAVPRVHSMEKDGFWVQVEMKTVVKSTAGAVVADLTCNEQHEGSAGRAYATGNSGDAVFKAPTEEGLQVCIEQLASGLHSVDLASAAPLATPTAPPATGPVATPPAQPAATPTPAATPAKCTVDQILKMKNAGLSDEQVNAACK